MKQNSVVDALQKAVKGLQYTSETEAELEPFTWGAGDLSKENLCKLAGVEKGTAIEEATLASFFRTVSKEDKPKFNKLARVLKEQLTGVKVYKIGDEAEREVYVVGKTTDGQWAGVKTTVVET